MKARGFVRSARRVVSVDGSFTIMGGPSRLAAGRFAAGPILRDGSITSLRSKARSGAH